MIMRSAHGWQLILADLSLILFLVTLTALVSSSSDEAQSRGSEPYVAPAQALFRQVEGGPGLSEWLAEQAADPRAALTIIARHGAGDRDAVWQEAEALAQSAEDKGVAVRVVITKGEASDVYASLAYDAPELER